MDDLIRREDAMQRFLDEVKQSGKDHIHINTIKRLLDDVDVAHNMDKVEKYFEDKINAVKQTPYINDYLQNLGMQTIMVNIIEDLLRVMKKGDVDDNIDIPFL